MPYETVSSRLMYKGRIIDVYLDEITLPDGRLAKREVVNHGYAAAIVAIDREGLITLVRQYRHGAKRMVLEIPAGMVGEGETVEECAVRELEEETGLVAGKILKLIDFHVSVGYCTEIISVFLAEDLSEGCMNLDQDEFLDIEKYSIDEIENKIICGEITDSKTLIGIFLAKRQIGL